MSHSHPHDHAHATAAARLPWAIGLTVLFVIGEAIAGWLAHSIALISDAAHNLTDVFALGLSAWAIWVSRRPASPRSTFGHHRSGVLAALANSLALVAIGAGIIYEGFSHLLHPAPVKAVVVIVVSLVAVIVNIVIGLWLHKGAADLNIRAAYLHQVGDAASAAGVAVSGIIALTTGALWPDGAVSILIGVGILWSAWSVLRKSITILMEHSPEQTDMAQVESALLSSPGVLGVHDLHVWTIASGMLACSCHVVVAEQTVREGQEILRNINTLLRQQFGITHTTVQVEVEGCEPDRMYCELSKQHRHPHNSSEKEHA